MEVKKTEPPPPSDAIVVSVVVLNYNGAKWIEKCIQSVLDQSLPGIELIVADFTSSLKTPATSSVFSVYA